MKSPLAIFQRQRTNLTILFTEYLLPCCPVALPCCQHFLKVHVRLRRSVIAGLRVDGVAAASLRRRRISQALGAIFHTGTRGKIKAQVAGIHTRKLFQRL